MADLPPGATPFKEQAAANGATNGKSEGAPNLGVVQENDSAHFDSAKEGNGTDTTSHTVLNLKPTSEASVRLSRFRNASRYLGKRVNVPTQVVGEIATIDYHNRILNGLWLLLIICVVPAGVGLLWFAAIPLWDTYNGDFGDKALFIFLINPGTQCILSFLLTQLFFAAIDDENPWRPFKYYGHILLANYLLQVLVIGLAVGLAQPFAALGLVTLAMTLLVTFFGLKVTSFSKLHSDTAMVARRLTQFRKCLIVFFTMVVVLLLYIVGFDQLAKKHTTKEANGKTHEEPEEGQGAEQGILTACLQIVTFILKKFNLAMTDLYPIEVAMVISGLWLENLVDLFITLAYPTAAQPGVTFAIIWVTRVLENLAYLVFQTNTWWRFRVWIKGKFKKDQKESIEEDIDPDDRGHSNIRPGYLRRQLRFLLWKLFSQLSSAVFFLTVIPALRYSYNNSEYPFSSEPRLDIDVKNTYATKGLSRDNFLHSIYFALATFGTVAASIGVVYLYMRHKHPETIRQLAEKYRFLLVNDRYLGLIFTVMVSNVMLAVSAVSVPYRLYFF